MKQEYETPEIYKAVVFHSKSVLAGSVVDDIAGIETGGQSVGGYFDDSTAGSTFNHEWGD